MKKEQKNRGWGRIKLDRRVPKYFYRPPLDRLPKLRTLWLDIYEHAKEDYDDGNLYYIPNYRRLRRAGVTGITAKRYLRKACQERIFSIVGRGAHRINIYKVGRIVFRRYGLFRSFAFNYTSLREGIFKNWVER